jgi:hypothetical protein
LYDSFFNHSHAGETPTGDAGAGGAEGETWDSAGGDWSDGGGFDGGGGGDW